MGQNPDVVDPLCACTIPRKTIRYGAFLWHGLRTLHRKSVLYCRCCRNIASSITIEANGNDSEGVIVVENIDPIERLFTYLDEVATVLEKEGNVTYLEGIASAGENLFYEEICQNVGEGLKETLLEKLENVKGVTFEAEQVRKAFQLATLKGMKQAVMPHHTMTPDAVCLFMSYLLNKLVGHDKKEKMVLDLATGTGNLMYAAINHSTTPLQMLGVEVDETLLKLAYISANLQKHEVQLFHRDSIEPLPLPDVDAVLTDLPAGYYPKDEVAQSYTLRRENEHSYLHHLMIEQAINKTKDGGYLIFLIPNFLFESDQAKELNEYIKETTNIIGLLQLPNTLFQSEKHAKSIFILQKKAEWTKQPRQALLAELPSFSNKEALADMMRKIDQWLKEEHLHLH